MTESEKRVDETWKQQVRGEKKVTEAGAEQGLPGEAVDFATFVATLRLQALVQMGQAQGHGPDGPLPVQEPDLEAARYTIDVMELLKDKTKGNLTAEEASLVDKVLYDVHMRFLAASKAGGATSESASKPEGR